MTNRAQQQLGMGQIELVSTVSMNFNIRMVVVCLSTVLPEIFARDLFSLNFTVGVGLHKLRAHNFKHMRKFSLHGIYCHLHMV